jgi:hypothetical protein
VATPTFFPTHEALRRLVEENLDALLGLRYLETHFHLVDLPRDIARECREIDTLAFDPVSYAPVAIEYRDRVSQEQAAQGLAMLKALPTQAQVLRYLAKRAGFSPERIEWGKMRVLFIGREAPTVTPVPSRSREGGTELWKCELYASDFLILEHLVTFQAAMPQAPAAAPGSA